ncbi:hypothetical protein KR51_00003520 [Rubidibacter lacunae KORDI 51-2]|uniref:Tfp pilus assembly protein PilO n=1 Tax=Rubidibacter lacunae KORDI 51-2 TaxID=582515 RepID=U5DMZ1_9CHRO|nr:hypothetical protein [Rubidibacter lacunae]ERN43036.1 hypothetical protein KR51_00003520 [Rubidibacter lacunae KORDI 51-2]
MSFTNDFALGQDDELPPEYPTVFGLTLTPQVSGVLLGVAGFAIALYAWLNFVQPARARYDQLVQQRNDAQRQIDEQPSVQKDIAAVQDQLQTARSRQQQVLALLSSESSLDTILVDLEKTLIEVAGNATSSKGGFELREFSEVDAQAVIVTDDSFGEAINGKIKRKRYQVETSGTFQQTRAVLAELERLQPLLIVRNLDTKVDEPTPFRFDRSRQGFVATASPQLRTTFQLEAVLPLTEAEKAAAAAEAAEAAAAEVGN